MKRKGQRRTEKKGQSKDVYCVAGGVEQVDLKADLKDGKRGGLTVVKGRVAARDWTSGAIWVRGSVGWSSVGAEMSKVGRWLVVVGGYGGGGGAAAAAATASAVLCTTVPVASRIV